MSTTTTSTPTTGSSAVEPEEILNPMQHVGSIRDVTDFVKAEQDDKKSSVQNLASHSAGARILFATDEWFASADNLLKDSEPVFDPEAYCEQGKVMDGWESRRRREAGHDWCIIKLAKRASIDSLMIDTMYFTGNQVPNISLQAADVAPEVELHMAEHFPGAFQRLLHGSLQGTGATPREVQQADEACQSVVWKELLPKTRLNPGYPATRYHRITLQEEVTATLVRVNYYPDGGVARLRLFGTPLCQSNLPTKPAYSPIVTGRTCSVVPHLGSQALPSREMDLPQLSLNGSEVACSNQHYGVPSHLLQDTYGVDMGDGWETARKSERPSVLVQKNGLVDSNLSDYCILKLGQAGRVRAIILDTKHFRGNYPESVFVEGCEDDYLEQQDDGDEQEQEWFPLVPRGRLAPDSEHLYMANRGQVENEDRVVRVVRVTIFPDGGLSRVRVYGEPAF